jgi:hypothetical protein
VTRLVLGLALLGGMVGPARAQDYVFGPGPGPLSLPGYVAALDELRADLEMGRRDEARGAARALRARQIAWENETLWPDPSVLEAVAQVDTPADARLQAARVRRLVEALGGESDRSMVTPQPDVLSRLVPEPEIERGGEAPRLRVKPLTFPERVGAALLAVSDWIADALRKLRRWLRRLWPSRPGPGSGEAGATATVAVVFAVVVAVLLAILALRSLRRGGRAPIDAVSARALSSSRDEDPLSREVAEWESYAHELAGRRRWREAIRAWYHAVLVALFRSGRLHHQRGRTNWEYVSRLAPDLPWRAGFVRLTRRFDREWYGRRTSDGAALSECAREARDLLRAVRGAEETA